MPLDLDITYKNDKLTVVLQQLALMGELVCMSILLDFFICLKLKFIFQKGLFHQTFIRACVPPDGLELIARYQVQVQLLLLPSLLHAPTDSHV